MMKLYTADFSPYSARIRMQVYAKGISDIIFELPEHWGMPKFRERFPIGRVPVLDTDGDLKWVNKGVVFNPSASSGDLSQVIERLVTETPSTVNDLNAKTNQPKWEIRKTLKQLGYRRGRGRHGTWVKS